MPAVIAIAVFVAGYAAIASERFDRVKVVLVGAGLLLATQVVDLHDAFYSERVGVDWNVIFLLLGMMVMVAGVRRTGLFDYLALHAVRLTRGRPFALLTLLIVLTAVASALVDNVTTVLLIAPVIISITRDLRLPPLPYLLSVVFASNIGGTATLIGDPPNIIIGSQAGLSYIDFLVNLAPLVLVLLIAFVGTTKLLFGSMLDIDVARLRDLGRISPRDRLTDIRMLAWTLGTLLVVTLGFALHSVLRYESSTVALLGAGVILLVTTRPAELLREVEWPTLAFFAGLFIMVGALVKVGVINSIATWLTDVIDGRLLLGCMLLLVVSALLSAVVDNIPYVATMAPIVATLTADLPAADGDPLWWSLALGADLGGNATPIGASANLIVLAIAARHGHTIGFGLFVRYGIVVTATTILISAAYIYLRYFVIS